MAFFSAAMVRLSLSLPPIRHDLPDAASPRRCGSHGEREGEREEAGKGGREKREGEEEEGTGAGEEEGGVESAVRESVWGGGEGGGGGEGRGGGVSE